MRVNRQELAAGLTRDQLYLVACWHNMVHAQSLDSHRVRVVNPEYGLLEMLRMQEFKGAKADERKLVREEVKGVLENDPVLRNARYALPVTRLLRVMADPAVDKDDGAGATGNLLRYFSAELEADLRAHYVADAMRLLGDVVVNGSLANMLEPARFAQISICVNNVLSTLISRGTSLEALFNLYKQKLLRPDLTFERRWEIVTTILTGSPEREFHIVIALDNVSSPDEFPPSIGGVEFARAPQLEVPEGQLGHRAEYAREYLVAGRSRLFASMRVTSDDARTAGAVALERLNRIVNLIRFEYEKAAVSIPGSFAFQLEGQPVRTLLFPSRVPNPSPSIDSAGVSAFVRSVDELVNGRFSPEGLDRVHSAFRLYRTGLDTTVLENKLTNWWTALEYLVRGAGADAGIGVSIERLVAPVLGLAYLPKHLLSHRSVLVRLCPPVHDPASGEPIELRSLTPLQLYHTLRRQDVQALLLPSLHDLPYQEEHLAAFLAMLQHPNALFAQCGLHEKRVRWHLQRLWRARCDIVHSASQQKSLMLLCANLEYYLKTTLMALLAEVGKLPTLTGPKEFFDRQQHAYGELLHDLQHGHDDVLVRLLQERSV